MEGGGGRGGRRRPRSKKNGIDIFCHQMQKVSVPQNRVNSGV
jgi:hypothetical protein